MCRDGRLAKKDVVVDLITCLLDSLISLMLNYFFLLILVVLSLVKQVTDLSFLTLLTLQVYQCYIKRTCYASNYVCAKHCRGSGAPAIIIPFIVLLAEDEANCCE